MMRIAAIVLCLGLAGCNVHLNDRAELAKQDDAKCQSYGAKPGTDGYVTCRTQLGTSRDDIQNRSYGGPTTCIRSGNVSNCN